MNRSEMVNLCFNNYDFPFEITDTDPVTQEETDLFVKRAYAEGPEGKEIILFKVRFEPDSVLVNESYALLFSTGDMI